jgi:hypothetical protein
MLALECLVFFTRRFPAVAAEMLFQYAMHARKGVSASFPSICGQVWWWRRPHGEALFCGVWAMAHCGVRHWLCVSWCVRRCCGLCCCCSGLCRSRGRTA